MMSNKRRDADGDKKAVGDARIAGLFVGPSLDPLRDGPPLQKGCSKADVNSNMCATFRETHGERARLPPNRVPLPLDALFCPDNEAPLNLRRSRDASAHLSKSASGAPTSRRMCQGTSATWSAATPACVCVCALRIVARARSAWRSGSAAPANRDPRSGRPCVVPDEAWMLSNSKPFVEDGRRQVTAPLAHDAHDQAVGTEHRARIRSPRVEQHCCREGVRTLRGTVHELPASNKPCFLPYMTCSAIAAMWRLTTPEMFFADVVIKVMGRRSRHLRMMRSISVWHSRFGMKMLYGPRASGERGCTSEAWSNRSSALPMPHPAHPPKMCMVPRRAGECRCRPRCRFAKCPWGVPLLVVPRAGVEEAECPPHRVGDMASEVADRLQRLRDGPGDVLDSAYRHAVLAIQRVQHHALALRPKTNWS